MKMRPGDPVFVIDMTVRIGVASPVAFTVQQFEVRRYESNVYEIVRSAGQALLVNTYAVGKVSVGYTYSKAATINGLRAQLVVKPEKLDDGIDRVRREALRLLQDHLAPIQRSLEEAKAIEPTHWR